MRCHALSRNPPRWICIIWSKIPLPYYLITSKHSLQCFSIANAIPKDIFSKRARIPREDTDVHEDELKPSLTTPQSEHPASRETSALRF